MTTETHYNTVSAEYDELWQYRKQYESVLIDDIFSSISRKDLDFNDMVLTDIGCGTGDLLKSIAKRATFKKFLAVEPCAGMLDNITEDGNSPIEKFCMDGATFTRLDTGYDASILNGMIHHFSGNKLIDFLSGVFNQTNPGGSVFISSYCTALPWPLWANVLETTLRVYPEIEDMRYIKSIVIRVGFTDVACVKKSYGDIVIPRDQYFWMVRNRFISPLSHLSDEEIEEGIQSMDYPDPVVFEDYQYYVTGRKSLAVTESGQ
jgi:SAM-dependent methyltransferase